MKIISRWSLLAVLAFPLAARAEFPSPQPYPEIRYEQRVQAEPAQRMYAAWIDLTDCDVSVRVAPGGPDPDGAGEYQTTLQVPSEIAAREHFEVTINGDFFAARPTVDVEGAPSGYVSGKWAKAIGPAVTDGFLWAPALESRAVFLLDANGRAAIMTAVDVPADARQVIAGSNILVKAGEVVVEAESSFSKTRHPRTAVGLADGGNKLLMLVVDGRRAGEASGMSLTELAALMLQMGCEDALNLDGGGSSELVMRDPEGGTLKVLNRPSDGRERAVANVLGVTLRNTRRAPTP